MRKEYNVNGQQVYGEEVEFEVDREGWNAYILHDGTKLKVKLVVLLSSDWKHGSLTESRCI